ncbi:hypothetical protein BH23BAC3_BH23BAC3_27100 [soil metagenome]
MKTLNNQTTEQKKMLEKMGAVEGLTAIWNQLNIYLKQL